MILQIWPGNLAKFAKWAGATIAAALIGSFSTSWYEAARPSIAVIDIRPSLNSNSVFLKDDTPVPLPQTLAPALEATAWSSIETFRSPTAPYKKLVDALDLNTQKMNTYLEDWGRLKADLPRMRDILAHGDQATPAERDGFFDLWERNDGFIYGSLRGEFDRGSLDVTHKPYTGTPTFRLIQETISPDSGFPAGSVVWIVGKKGGRFSTYVVPRRDIDLGLNRAVAERLAYFDSAELMSFLDVIENSERAGESSAKNVLSEVDKARNGLSRWAVTFALSNRGGSPVAFMPFAIVEIDTSGLTVGGKPWGKWTELHLEHRGTDSELSPIYIDKGGAQLVTFASKDFIKDIEPSDTLTDAYHLGTLYCRARIFVASGDAFTRSEYRTAAVRFGVSDASTR